MRFTPSFSAVLWDPPATAGVLSGLSYNSDCDEHTTQVDVVVDEKLLTNTNYSTTSSQALSVLHS